MTPWLKLVGKADWPIGEHWVMERSDLLREIRFSERNAPDPIAQGDHLVYHAVGEGRLIAIVEIMSQEARYDASVEWERQWPLVHDVRPVMRVGRVSTGPATSLLGLETGELKHQSFLRLASEQYQRARGALVEAGAR